MYFSNRQHISKNKWSAEKLQLWRGRKALAKHRGATSLNLRNHHFYKKGRVHKK